MDIVCLDLNKTFDTVSHKILIEKLWNYGLDKQAARIEMWLNSQAQSMVLSGTQSSQTLTTSSVPQRQIFNPVLLNIFINDLAYEVWCSLRKFTDDVQLREVIDTPKGHAAIQRDTRRLGKCTDRNLLRFYKLNCKVLHLERKTTMHQDNLGAT